VFVQTPCRCQDPRACIGKVLCTFTHLTLLHCTSYKIIWGNYHPHNAQAESAVKVTPWRRTTANRTCSTLFWHRRQSPLRLEMKSTSILAQTWKMSDMFFFGGQNSMLCFPASREWHLITLQSPVHFFPTFYSWYADWCPFGICSNICRCWTCIQSQSASSVACLKLLIHAINVLTSLCQKLELTGLHQGFGHQGSHDDAGYWWGWGIWRWMG